MTVSGKTRHVAIFAKIAIALYLSSTTFELTLLQIRDRSPAPFPRYSALCPTTRQLLNSRNYGLKALLCARILSPYTTSVRKSPVGGASRSNETHERMATRTARRWPSAASFGRSLEESSCQPVLSTNSPPLAWYSN